MIIIILGTGGVGGYLGAKLWKAGNEVIFVSRGEHLARMKSNGMRLISPEGNISVDSIFTDNLNQQSPVDLIIVSVKSFDTHSAASLISPVIKDDTIVLSIQNGVENENLLATSIGASHILGGVAYIFSTISESGVIIHHGKTARFKFGELNGKMSERCKMLEDIFLKAGIDAKQKENIILSKWEKWIFICGLSGMTAYTRKSVGDILKDATLKDMLMDIVREATTVGRTKSIDAFENYESKVLAHFQRLPPESTSSMYYDLTHNKRLEVEALNGTVVRFGKELKIPTPANETIYNALKVYA